MLGAREEEEGRERERDKKGGGVGGSRKTENRYLVMGRWEAETWSGGRAKKKKKK